jgi:hypothetical protein
MEVVEEWAGCNLSLGLGKVGATKNRRGLAAWAAAWALEVGGGARYLEIWREGEQALFQGQELKGAANEMQARYEAAVRAKRTQGYIAVAFGDARRGSIPSFTGGEGIQIAAVGAVNGATPSWSSSLSQKALEMAMANFQDRLGQSWTGMANAKVLLAELQQIKQRVEAYCEASQDKTACAQLQAELENVKAAVEQVLTA